MPASRLNSYYGECIAASDLCKMPISSSFVFRYMLCFYDLATKYLELYYLRNAIDTEVQNCFNALSSLLKAIATSLSALLHSRLTMAANS
eukprot:6194188-Pleurochrysis_carterae.AAC.5